MRTWHHNCQMDPFGFPKLELDAALENCFLMFQFLVNAMCMAAQEK